MPLPALLQDLIDNAALRPSSPAVAASDGELSYEEFHAEVRRVARWLVANGVEPGQRVGFTAHKTAASVIAMFAVMRAGGFPAGISGAELTERAVLQADKFGARISIPVEATGLHPKDEDHYVVAFADGSEIAARAVVLATGARYRRLQVPGIERLEGTSVHYSANVYEAQQCRTDPVAVVGGGNSAGQAVLFLAGYAPKVHLLVRGPSLEANMSRYLVEQVERHPRVEVMLHTEVTEVIGQEVLEELDVVDNRTGGHRRLAVRGLFVFTGADPHTEWFAGIIALDSRGFVLTGPEAQEACAYPEVWDGRGRSCMTLETSLPGVFAVGDVRSGSVKRVASAAGEGAMAIHFVHRHLGHSAAPGTTGTSVAAGGSDASPRTRHKESAWLA